MKSEDKNKLKMQFNTKEKWLNNDWRSILANNIIFDIHIWHFVVSYNQISTKLDKDLWIFRKHYTCKMSFGHCYKIAYIILKNKIK
jgi:hypothetical protein